MTLLCQAFPRTRYGKRLLQKQPSSQRGVSSFNRCCQQVTRTANHGTWGTAWSRTSHDGTSSTSSIV
ncbi:hypothetical protein [Yersinia frederiksenii]|uniref:hypothetical protein n=1 Tax=Yersinia frederiksenii TaxID=29484 RepID=UPI00067D9846|nr:hypothetical protein [Yersinia frederiksenii]